MLLAIITGCKQKNKKISLAGDEKVELADFIDFFRLLDVPYQVSDSIFQKKEKDSLLISKKIFSQFVPDSILSKTYSKTTKPKIYAIGKIEIPNGEYYLLVKTVTPETKAVFLICFDNKRKYIAGMPVLKPDNNSATTSFLIIDKRATITKLLQRKNADGTISDGKDVYVLNTDARSFMLIMTDALGDKVTELINPIDTLPRRHKLSADYGSDKMNLVSIRDGRKNDRLTFFVHFEKAKGECTGELKGEALFKSPNTAEYRESGDPCILKFNFSATSVSLTEENCGSRRGLKCLFDGSFARKKYIKPSTAKKPAKKK